MISVKYSEAVICIYSDYCCRDASCPLNKLHKPKETHFTITDIEPSGRIKIVAMLLMRVLIVLLEIGSRQPISKVSFILSHKWMWGKSIRVRPGVVIPNDRK